MCTEYKWKNVYARSNALFISNLLPAEKYKFPIYDYMAHIIPRNQLVIII